MFEGSDYPIPLNNDKLMSWIHEAVKAEKEYVVVVWDDIIRDYHPFLAGNQEELLEFTLSMQDTSNDKGEVIVAVFDTKSGNQVNPSELLTEN